MFASEKLSTQETIRMLNPVPGVSDAAWAQLEGDEGHVNFRMTYITAQYCTVGAQWRPLSWLLVGDERKSWGSVCLWYSLLRDGDILSCKLL